MKTYFVDTNVFLRFFLKDNPSQYEAVLKHFTKAGRGEEKLILIPQVVMEVSFLLEKFYKLGKEKTLEYLVSLVNNPDFAVPERKVLIRMLDTYKSVSIDLVDAYLYSSAQEAGAEVLSFDRDFRRISAS